MVYGNDLLENVRLLAGTVAHIEILLFHAPDLHNIPEAGEIRALREVGERSKVTFSVHLPASLEIASMDKGTRQRSLHLARDICRLMAEVNPLHFVLHVPYTAPTLVPVPDLYFQEGIGIAWDDWRERALESIALLHETVGNADRLLVENINYSPSLLEPLLATGNCRLCLDIGHLLLGQEDATGSIRRYQDEIRTIHLHGVRGYEDHLSLSRLSDHPIEEWLRCLTEPSRRTVILEVFTPQDLEESIDIVLGKSHRIVSGKEK